MFSLRWNLSAELCGYLRFYMPTNRAVDRMRGPLGLEWAMPVCLIATLSYLLALSICATLVERGGPAYLLVMLCAWNGIKFATAGVLIPVRWLTLKLSSFSVSARRGCLMDRLTELRTAIAHNAVAGGSAYGRAAAEVVALSLEGQPDEEVAVVVSRTTEWLISTKPSITSMRTVAFAALEASLSSEDPRGAVLARMRTFIADSERAIASIADHAASMIKPGDKVLYDSYSGSLVQLFLRAVETTPGLTVMLTESRPYRSHNCRIGRAGGPCSVTHEHV